MSLIADVIGEVVSQLVGEFLGHLLHGTGRRLIFLLSFGRIHIPSLDRGGGGFGANFAAIVLGLLCWSGLLAGALYWALS
jgi:hypothetical protein